MSLPFAFLLTYIAGVLTAWLFMRTSRNVDKKRMGVIKDHITAMGGHLLSIDLIDRNNCPYSKECQDPDLVYKFYKVNYDVDHDRKEGWAILDMKQNWYGPSGAIRNHWTWHFN